VDGAVNGVGIGTKVAGGWLRLIQSGDVQRYAVFLFGGVSILGLAITRHYLVAILAGAVFLAIVFTWLLTGGRVKSEGRT
jgi:predicted membrane protein